MGTMGYTFTASKSGYLYWFTSIGPKGSILKIVTLQPTKKFDRFNLAMGDEIDGNVDYYHITNNNDRDKIFSTIAEIVRAFLNRFPRNEIFITGNTPARIRLYQSQVSNNLQLIIREFKVYGQKQFDGRFKKFQQGERYTGILISNK